MIYRMVGTGCILAGTIGIGMSIVSNNRSHKKELEQILFFLQQMTQGILYEKCDLLILCVRMQKITEAPFYEIFSELSHALENRMVDDFAKSWRDCFEKGLSNTHLNREEKEKLYTLGTLFFAPKEEHQAKLLHNVETYVEGRMKRLDEEAPEKNRVILCVSAVLGCLFCLFLS